MLVQHFNQNLIGTDYIVGDIHGCYTLLYQKLKEIGFNKVFDRLFCTGDLVDRGEESIKCLDILAEPWFYTVLGNHDQMAYDWVYLKDDIYAMSPSLYERNGGAWFMALEKETQTIIADKFAELPILIEIETASGLVGIVHADCPFNDWESLKQEVLAKNGRVILQCLWNRDRIKTKDKSVIKGVSKVYHGHTVLEIDGKLGNRHYIDTGAVFPGGYFTILKLC